MLSQEELRRKRWRKEVKRRKERQVKTQMYTQDQVAQYDLHKKVIREQEAARCGTVAWIRR